MAYLKGADTTLGYMNTVGAGEYYSSCLIQGLAGGLNFGAAVEYANELFMEIYPTYIDNTSPVNSTNRAVYGSTSTTI